MNVSFVESRTLAAGVARDLTVSSLARESLTFFPSAALYSVAPQGVEPSATVGWSIAIGSTPLTLERSIHGDIVERAWRGFSTAGGEVLILQNIVQVSPIK